MRSYKQLSQEQRYQIEILKKTRKNQNQIAELQGPSAGTICRSCRGTQASQGYRPKQARVKADTRRKQAAKAVKMTALAIAPVEEKIALDWSPEQVAGWLAAEQGILSQPRATLSAHLGRQAFGKDG
jgi:transposase, IS30 family